MDYSPIGQNVLIDRSQQINLISGELFKGTYRLNGINPYEKINGGFNGCKYIKEVLRLSWRWL